MLSQKQTEDLQKQLESCIESAIKFPEPVENVYISAAVKLKSNYILHDYQEKNLIKDYMITVDFTKCYINVKVTINDWSYSYKYILFAVPTLFGQRKLKLEKLAKI